MSAKQKYLIFAALVITILVIVSLLLYPMTQSANYEGVFVSSVRQLRGR